MDKIYAGYNTLCVVLVCLLLAACTDTPHDAVPAGRQPRIYPDYIGVTIPAEIAPLNFNLAGDTVDCVDVVVSGADGTAVHANGDLAQFDIDEWHALTSRNKGKSLTVTVCTKKDGRWLRYDDFKIHVSRYPLGDWGLTYRRIAPGYEVYSSMGLYQRDLSDFSEYALIENTQVPGMCVNCHTANRTNPDQFVFHVRGDHGATMIQRNGKREWLKAKNDSLGGSMVYPYWHPDGRFCAFSTNQTRQGFHTNSRERIEVFDLSSDIFVYDTEKHEIILDTMVATRDYSENCPVFAPDGKTLYFTSCLQQNYPENYKREQYNLYAIGFDAAAGKFDGRPRLLFDAVAMNKSVTWPRPSYDGRFLLFTLIDYGYFSIWHDESEQWMLDLKTGKAQPIAALHSRRADSFHNWSANSRWIVFTSRRGDGLYTRLYLAEVDEQGRVSKPFLLPQKNPWEYYSRLMHAYNTPDFAARKADFDARAAGREIISDERVPTHVRP